MADQIVARQPLDGVLRDESRGPDSAERKPVKTVGKDHEQNDPDPEDRQRAWDQHEQAAEPLDPMTSLPTEIRSEGYAEQGGDQDGYTHQQHRVPKHGQEHVEDRAAKVERHAEIAGEQIVQVVEILLIERGIETPGLAQCRDCRRRQLAGAAKDSRRVPGYEPEHDPQQGHDGKERNDGLDGTPEYERPDIHVPVRRWSAISGSAWRC